MQQAAESSAPHRGSLCWTERKPLCTILIVPVASCIHLSYSLYLRPAIVDEHDVRILGEYSIRLAIEIGFVRVKP